MIKDYCKATIQWNAKANNGYGTTYGSTTNVQDVYIEKNIKLNRGTDDTTKADAMFVIYQNLSFAKGDKITMDSLSYTITSIDKYFKPRSTTFDHLEVYLSEVNNG